MAEESKNSKNRPKKDEDESLGRFILDIIIIFAVVIGIYTLVFRFVLSNETISGPSMEPTFENGDRVIAVRHFTLKRGDVVIVKAPDEPGALYIKRIIGLPGEKLVSKNDQIYINGHKISQPWLKAGDKLTDSDTGTEYSETQNFTLPSLMKARTYQQYFTKSQIKYVEKTGRIPKDTYFVMGDHRSVSKDSRYIGTFKRSSIVGEVKWRYWPLNQWKVF